MNDKQKLKELLDSPLLTRDKLFYYQKILKPYPKLFTKILLSYGRNKKD